MTAMAQAKATMTSIRLSLILTVIIWLGGHISLTARNTDFRSRLGVNLSADLTQDLGLGVSFEQRFSNHLTLIDKALAEPELYYKLNKNFRIGGTWRISYDRSYKGYYSVKHRYTGYLRYRFLIDDFDCRIKTALQYGVDDLTSSIYSTDNNLIHRNSFDIKYKWFGKPFTPGLGFELYTHLNHPQGTIVNQLRAKAGVTYKINKKSDLELYYLFDNEFNIAYPTSSHILGLSYSFGL